MPIDRDTTLDEARAELKRLEAERVELEIEVSAKSEKLVHVKSEISSLRYVLGIFPRCAVCRKSIQDVSLSYLEQGNICSTECALKVSEK